jgi:hypothetical protein
MTKQQKNAPTAEELAAIANEEAAQLHAMRLELAAQALADFMRPDNSGKSPAQKEWGKIK